MLTFFDLVNPIDVATAAQNAMVLRGGKYAGRAVQPAVDLQPALRAAGARQQAGEEIAQGKLRLANQQAQLAVGEKRLGTANEILKQRQAAYDYEKSQIPITTGLGVLGGALGVYRGYRGLQDADVAAARQAQSTAIQQETMRQSQASAAKSQELSQMLIDYYKSKNLPPPMQVDTGPPYPSETMPQ